MTSLTLFSTQLHATVVNHSVKTAQGAPLTIDLNGVITNITTVNVQVASAPAAGNTAVAVTCSDLSNACVLYTPDPAFVGVDSFDYSVVNDLGATEVATVTVRVGDVSQAGNVGVIPAVEVENMLENTLCLGSQTGDLLTLCTILATTAAGSEDRRILIRALTPEDVAAQGSMDELLATAQLNNITRHLAALRNTQQQVAIGGLSFRLDSKNIQLAELLKGTQSGGAAGSGGNALSWFINGDISNGEQEETLYEDGFDFFTGTVSTGLDLRLNSGVVGLAWGLSKTSTDVLYEMGGLEALSNSVIAYGSYYPTQETYVDFIISANFTRFESERRIVFGTFDDLVSSQNDATSVALRLESGVNLAQSGAFNMSLDFKAEYTKTNIDGYIEQGNSLFAVTIDDRESNQAKTILGTSMSYAISTGVAVIRPQMDLYWVHQFNEEAGKVQGFFNADPTQTRFAFDSNLPDTDYLKLGLGMSIILPGGSTGFVQLGTVLDKDYTSSRRLSMGLRLEL
ncbi:MAG: autotransporter domain-containing protein [Gammaproteobacteria bacterium]|nr:autotransporter domain-containing protein [Gammaproteobacteria bacterium]MDH5802081.1 autotransporter domain-containing protein [Gammaproteobacteria bacterium]